MVPAIGGLAILSGVYAEIMRRPSTAQAELRISLSELRSEITESGLLATHAKNGDPLRNFVREHAHQLEKHMRATVDDVRGRSVKAGEAKAGEMAARRGESALASLHLLGAEPAPSATVLGDVASTMDSSSQELSRLVSTLSQQPR